MTQIAVFSFEILDLRFLGSLNVCFAESQDSVLENCINWITYATSVEISRYYWMVSIFAKFDSRYWTVVNLHDLYLRIFIKRFHFRFWIFLYFQRTPHFWIWKKKNYFNIESSRSRVWGDEARMTSSKPWNHTALNIGLHQRSWDLPLIDETIEFHGSCRHVGDRRIMDLCCRLSQNRRRRAWWRGLSINKIQSCNPRALNRSRTLFLSRVSLWKKKNWAE